MYTYDTLTFQAKENSVSQSISQSTEFTFYSQRAQGDLPSQLEMYGVAE